MDEEYWSVKRFAYACVCISPNYHGSVTIWNTEEEAWDDAKERANGWINEEDSKCFECQEVYDGYEIVYKDTYQKIMCYKVFDMQELE